MQEVAQAASWFAVTARRLTMVGRRTGVLWLTVPALHSTNSYDGVQVLFYESRPIEEQLYGTGRGGSYMHCMQVVGSWSQELLRSVEPVGWCPFVCLILYKPRIDRQVAMLIAGCC